MSISLHPSVIRRDHPPVPGSPAASPTSLPAPQTPCLSPMATAVHQAVDAMREDLLCDRGIEGIAEDTFYSKFHFTREFTKATGTTPRRFLAALRMAKAKDLLTSTQFGIADVSNMVGYSSVGTFSSRFSSLVGVAPREWRVQGKVPTASPCEGPGDGIVHGTVVLEDGACHNTPLFIGLYPDTVPQGRPVACTITQEAGFFELQGVPEGEWTLIVQAGCADSLDGLRGRATVRVWAKAARTRQLPVQVTVRACGPLDPPAIYEGARMWEDTFTGSGATREGTHPTAARQAR